MLQGGNSAPADHAGSAEAAKRVQDPIPPKVASRVEVARKARKPRFAEKERNLDKGHSDTSAIAKVFDSDILRFT